MCSYTYDTFFISACMMLRTPKIIINHGYKNIFGCEPELNIIPFEIIDFAYRKLTFPTTRSIRRFVG